MSLKVLELFAGIGACSKALENLGIDHEIVDAVEIDKFAIKVLMQYTEQILMLKT